jgi:hypothetical protein
MAGTTVLCTQYPARVTKEAEPNHSPFFRVSAKLLGRMFHMLKRQYVDDDEKRKTAKILNDHVTLLTKEVETAVINATALIKDRQQAHAKA